MMFWRVIRMDDNGFREIMAHSLSKTEAEFLVQKMESRNHKQTYVIELEENKISN
jgi:hypothetical protein